MTPVCPTCASAVPDGAKFCGECGAPLLPRCGLCGSPAARMGQKFCLECGTPLVAGVRPASAPGTAQRPGPAPPAVVAPSTAERRLVSVLFADLGFTAFSEIATPRTCARLSRVLRRRAPHRGVLRRRRREVHRRRGDGPVGRPGGAGGRRRAGGARGARPGRRGHGARRPGRRPTAPRRGADRRGRGRSRRGGARAWSSATRSTRRRDLSRSPSRAPCSSTT